MKRKLQILHLEDNKIDAELVQSELAGEGIECETVLVETREDFISAVEKGGFDIILADYSLPSFDGISALAIVQKKCPEVPFIFVTGSLGEEMAIDTLKKGATDYVIKDKISRLVPAVRRALKEIKEQADLKRAEQHQKLVNQVLELLNQSGEKTDIIRDILLLIQEATGFEAVGIRLKEGEDFPYYQTSGFSSDFVEAERYLCARDQAGELIRDSKGNPYLECMCGNVICGRTNPSLPFFTKGGSFWTNSTSELLASTTEEDRQARTRNRCNGEGYESVALIPLRSGSKIIGLLQLNDRRRNLFTLEIIRFFESLGASIGITLSRKYAEEELKQLKHQHELILQSAGEGIIGLDLEGKHIFVNPASSRMLGYEVEELIGKQSHTIWHHSKPDGTPYPEEECLIYASYRKGNICLRIRDEVFWRKDGTSFPVAYTSTPILEDGKIVGAVVTFTDITKFKQAEEALRESEEKYRSLFEDSKDVVYISTIEGKFLDINSAGVELFGYDSKEELLKVDIAKDLYLNPYDRKKFIQTMHQQGFVKDYELLMERKDGEILTLLSTAIPYRDKEGKITEYRGIMRDVTHQRKLEQQLLHAQKMEAVGQLTGGIAHDFNNILTAIVGYSSLLQMKMSKDDPLRHNADQILASSERAANLVQSLLAFSRKQIINLQPVTLNGIVKRIEKLLLRLIGEDIDIKTILTEEDLTIMADPGQIEQVFMNLATNARDAMPNGGHLTVKTGFVKLDNTFIKAHGYGEPGMYTFFTVTDTGVGIDDKTREKIFEPFFTTKEVGKGTGLGLSMVYGIIKQHNGYIDVYSAPKKGTTFVIYLPLIKAEVKELKPTEPPPTIGGTETILIAEDDADVRKFTKHILEEFGYKVIDAEDGDDAINKFMENKDKIHLLMLDVIMPKKSGKVVYDEIKKLRPDMKALFMSGYSKDVLAKEGTLEEGSEFVLKPISPTNLLRKIREALEK